MQDMKVDERSAKQSLQALSKELKVQDEAVTAFREVTWSILKGSFHAKCVTHEPTCLGAGNDRSLLVPPPWLRALICAHAQRVLQLRRDTETGVRTFMRSKGWRDVSKVEPISPLSACQFGADVVVVPML